METKPYNLQSPEQIAKDYGGNKQKIAEAMQMGIVDPTAGVLAGMFIDRMRSAQTQEMAPQQTVAQQVFTPPAPPAPPMGAMPPAGLGATPEAAAMGGAQPPMMGGAPMPPDMPAEEPPMGMAAGGLTTLPLSDDMFSEPDYGGYASGGLVAFAEGGPAQEQDDGLYYGYNYRDPRANLATVDQLFGAPQTRYADEAEQEFLRRRGPEYQRGQRRRDIGQLMAEAGFGMMAGNSPNAFQNIGAALLPALSNATERAKERRADEREIQRGLLDIEAGRNTAAARRAAQALEMQNIGIRGREAEAAREFDARMAREKIAADERMLERRIAADLRAASISGRGGGGGGGGREPQVDMAEDPVTIPGGQGMPSTTIDRYRVRVRGTTDFAYIFPQLGNNPINPAHGVYGVGVTNAMRWAQSRGYGLGISPTDARLQFIGRDGRSHTIDDRRMQHFESLGARFNPNEYTTGVRPRSVVRNNR
jgi:hypothetical protein